ncbi:MAG: hemolysin III family protein [Spirochaetes bacterium]|nr:hemolysin III family protein [Spirochaetota bacterium]
MQLNKMNSVSKYVKLITKNSTAAVLPLYTIGEEIANSVLHGIGALAAIAGLVFLNLKNSGVLGGHRAADMDIVSAVLFAVTMIGMFLISTLYHAIQLQSVKRIFRKLDHSVIFIFIAGTYTPICLSGLRGAWGWSLFAVEWALALTGIILNILNSKTLKKIEITVYIMMGWAIIIGFVPLIHRVPVISVILLLAGGAAYTLGAVFYKKKSIKHTHVIWHTFVIIGAVCHWFSIWYLI